MSENLGGFLSEKRKEAKLTQKQLAKKLFVTESTISKWESNKSNPDISMISDIARILNVSEHELITASIDDDERKQKKYARRWKILSNTWELFFLLSYGIALLTCFICNLAVNKTLSWFFVVLASLVLASSFTSIPKYIKHNRLLWIPLIELLSLFLLLGVCAIYTNGDWFLLAVTPIIFSFIVVFMPIYIAKLNFSTVIKKHNALISITLDLILLLVMLYIINLCVKGNWFGFAFLITLSWSIYAYAFVVMHYINISKILKASILTFIFAPYLLFGHFITAKLCLTMLNVEVRKIGFPDFTFWQTDEAISSNVSAIIFLTIIFVSVMLFVIYKIKQMITNRKKKPV